VSAHGCFAEVVAIRGSRIGVIGPFDGTPEGTPRARRCDLEPCDDRSRG
jgi:hypothetical protein